MKIDKPLQPQVIIALFFLGIEALLVTLSSIYVMLNVLPLALIISCCALVLLLSLVLYIESTFIKPNNQISDTVIER